MKVKHLLSIIVIVLGGCLFLCLFYLSNAHAGDIKAAGVQTKDNVGLDDNLIKIQRSEMIIPGTSFEDFQIVSTNVAIKRNDDKQDVSSRQQSSSRTHGVSIARISSGKNNPANAVDKMFPSARWRKRTVNLSRPATAKVKTVESKELKKMEKQRKERKATLEKSLESLPSRAAIHAKEDDSDSTNNPKINPNSIDNGQ